MPDNNSRKQRTCCDNKEVIACLRMVRTDEGKALRKQYEAHELHHGYNEYRQAEARTDGLVNTLSTVLKDNLIMKKCCAMRGRNMGTDKKWDQQLEIRTDELSNSLTTVEKDNMVIDDEDTEIRIRKLTPKECWRLMGFDDEDFDKAKASGVSDSQLYKQAGNSIVVHVLMEIFKNFFTTSP